MDNPMKVYCEHIDCKTLDPPGLADRILHWKKQPVWFLCNKHTEMASKVILI